MHNKTKAFPHSPWADNPKHRNTFVFNFEYFTIVGDECIPQKWQMADEELGGSENHVPVSRCSSIVALSLEAKPASKIRYRSRRNPLGRREGEVFDPFSPWHVLSIQAYPDWRSTVDSHDSTKHYVNGPEAFLMTLRAEFKDVQKRLMDVYNRISDLVTTPPDFMFKESIRDKLLFEDDDFTYSRRYFWAYQSLAIMNEDIKEMLFAYRSTFTDSVWNGSSRIIWPGDENSARHLHWRRRMESIRKDIERELRGLEEIDRLNDEKMKEIKGLRDNLFSGTSVLESRRSVQQQAITVIQGNNIKILTLVTIFFLPLTFVTSVFGMTNMDPNDNFVRFGIVTLAVCLPTYILIASLNTQSGFAFWTEKIHEFFTRNFWKHVLASCLRLLGIQSKWSLRYQTRPCLQNGTFRSVSNFLQGNLLTGAAYNDPPLRPTLKPRSRSATEGMAAREGLGPVAPISPVTAGVQTYSISPAITLERHAAVKFEPSPRSLTPDPQPAELKRTTHRAQPPRRHADNTANRWFSHFWIRKPDAGIPDDSKEYP